MARYAKDSSPKLTTELITELATAIKAGSNIETAVAYCGISKDTFYRWLRDAKKKEASDLHLELSYALERAFAEANTRLLLIIDQAAMGTPESYELNADGSIKKDDFGFPVVEKYKILPNWRAAAWRLERRHPETWGKNAKGINSQIYGEDEEQDFTDIKITMIEKGKRLKQLEKILNRKKN
ncbi:MAG: hypothetical protein WC635_05460 [Bacteriovorax sp.]